MSTSVQQIIGLLPVKKKKETGLGRNDLLVLLQGTSGLFSGALGKNPFESLSAAFTVVDHFASKCNSGPLQDILKKANKWLKFGKEYAALDDSSDLDFDNMDITSVPEVMKVIKHTPMRLSILNFLYCVLNTALHNLINNIII